MRREQERGPEEGRGRDGGTSREAPPARACPPASARGAGERRWARRHLGGTRARGCSTGGHHPSQEVHKLSRINV